MKILSGEPIKKSIEEKLLERDIKVPIKNLLLLFDSKNKNIGSEMYARSLTKLGEKFGVTVEKKYLEFDSNGDYFYTIHEIIDSLLCRGIMFLDYPKEKDLLLRNYVVMNWKTDIDCFSVENTEELYLGIPNARAMPCTVEAILRILDWYDIPVSGKNVTVIGRGLNVGKPLGLALLNRNATVTYCHSKTKNLNFYTMTADIIITATGIPHLVTADMVTSDTVIIDAGINSLNGKTVGDVYFDEVAPKVKAITPVPGGVGLITPMIVFQRMIF